MKKLTVILIATLVGLTSYSQPQKPERPNKLPAELKEQADAIKASVEAGEITHDQAKAKIKELLEQNKPEVGGEKPDVEVEKPEVEVQKPAKPELSDELKEKIATIKSLEKALHEDIKAKINELGQDASKLEIKEVVDKFKSENKDRFAEIKNAREQIKEELEANRPERPQRPELSDELKEKVAELENSKKEMREAQKQLHESLKDASEQEREELIYAFKEANKAKHEEIKIQAKVVKAEIRALVETEATRTSDL